MHNVEEEKPWETGLPGFTCKTAVKMGATGSGLLITTATMNTAVTERSIVQLKKTRMWANA